MASLKTCLIQRFGIKPECITKGHIVILELIISGMYHKEEIFNKTKDLANEIAKTFYPVTSGYAEIMKEPEAKDDVRCSSTQSS